MKKFAVYFLIFFLIIFDVNVVKGSEKWSVERQSILGNFVVINQKMKAIGDENALKEKENGMFKIKVMELLDQKTNEIDKLKKDLIEKQTKIDQQEQEIKTFRLQQEEMAIHGMKILHQTFVIN